MGEQGGVRSLVSTTVPSALIHTTSRAMRQFFIQMRWLPSSVVEEEHAPVLGQGLAVHEPPRLLPRGAGHLGQELVAFGHDDPAVRDARARRRGEGSAAEGSWALRKELPM